MKIIQGDCLTVLQTIPANSVQCCVTSPPYYGLRDYESDGQIGLEATPEGYIENLVKIFREVNRVLSPTGTLWVNIGDSYAGSRCGAGDRRPRELRNSNASNEMYAGSPPQQHLRAHGYKNKDLIGIPWMLAFALRFDGWYLRQDVIWWKKNPMTESVKDRFTKSHEYFFLLSKSKRYYFNQRAILEPADYDGRKDTRYKGGGKYANGFKPGAGGEAVRGHERWVNFLDDGRPARNKRDVWHIATARYKGAHFATMPADLAKPAILAGSKPGDVILDPFSGTGTTLQVARDLGRDAIGIELNRKYIKLTQDRLAHYA